MSENQSYHFVKNMQVFDNKWGKISKELSIANELIPQGIHSAIMCFGGFTKGTINSNIFKYILFGYGLHDNFDNCYRVFLKYKIIDKNYKIVNWNKYQKEFLHNAVDNINKVENVVDKSVEWKLSLVEDEVEYLVDKKTNPKLYQAWYYQRVKKGLSCRKTYDKLTSRGYTIETKQHNINKNTVENTVENIIAVEKVENVVEKVDTPQRTHDEIENKIEIEKESKKKINKKENTVAVAELPCMLEGIVLSQNWCNWVNYRKEVKKPLTETTMQQHIKTLIDFHNQGYDANTSIINSISSSWLGLFQPKNKRIDDNTQLQQNMLQNTTQVNHKNILDDLVKLNNYMILSSAGQTDIENIMKKRYNKPFDIIGLQTQYLSKFNFVYGKNNDPMALRIMLNDFQEWMHAQTKTYNEFTGAEVFVIFLKEIGLTIDTYYQYFMDKRRGQLYAKQPTNNAKQI